MTPCRQQCPDWKIRQEPGQRKPLESLKESPKHAARCSASGGCEWALSGSAPVYWQTARAGIHLGHPKSSGVKMTQIIKMIDYWKWVILPGWFQQKDIWEQCHQHAVSTRDEQQELLFDLRIAGYHTHTLLETTKGHAEDRTSNFLQGFQAKAWWWLYLASRYLLWSRQHSFTKTVGPLSKCEGAETLLCGIQTNTLCCTANPPIHTK